jgi:hypothetical protein
LFIKNLRPDPWFVQLGKTKRRWEPEVAAADADRVVLACDIVNDDYLT